VYWHFDRIVASRGAKDRGTTAISTTRGNNDFTRGGGGGGGWVRLG